MAKTLHEPTPTSAVARLLDRGAAARALQPVSDSAPRDIEPATRTTAVQDLNKPPPTPAPATKREFLLSTDAERTFNQLMTLYRDATGSRLTSSQLFRAILRAIAHALPEIEREVCRLGAMRLPANGRGFESQREHFERRLATAFAAGMRAAATYHLEADEAARTRDRTGR